MNRLKIERGRGQIETRQARFRNVQGGVGQLVRFLGSYSLKFQGLFGINLG